MNEELVDMMEFWLSNETNEDVTKNHLPSKNHHCNSTELVHDTTVLPSILQQIPRALYNSRLPFQIYSTTSENAEVQDFYIEQIWGGPSMLRLKKPLARKIVQSKHWWCTYCFYTLFQGIKWIL